MGLPAYPFLPVFTSRSEHTKITRQLMISHVDSSIQYYVARAMIMQNQFNHLIMIIRWYLLAFFFTIGKNYGISGDAKGSVPLLLRHKT